MHVGQLLLILYLLPDARGLVGYDCSTGNTQITSISLKNIGYCDIPEVEVQSTTKYIQLLQISNLKFTHVHHCKIEIYRQIFHCGTWGFLGATQNGVAEYMMDISSDDCRKIHKTKRFSLGHNIIDGLRSNATETRSITIAGAADEKGYCDGVLYSDPFGHYTRVVVQGTIKITLMDYLASVNLDENKLHLRQGYHCSFNQGYCNDMEGGYTFWERFPKDACNFDRYSVLYEGHAHRGLVASFNNNRTESEVIYTVETDENTFAVKQEKIITRCGFQLIQTEHPKLFILEGAKGSFFTSARMVSPKEMDVFIYVNSKFVYVEKHIRRQLKDLFRDIMKHRCELEQKVLRNSLSIASMSPDNFAYDFTQQPGHTSVLAGEVIYIIKCQPIVLKVRKVDDCYIELPVHKGEEDYFITARTHILKKVGTQIACSPILPVMYEVDDVCYKFLPSITEAKSPQTLQPHDDLSWDPRPIGKIADGGIYTSEELKQLQNQIQFPSDRPAILNIVARKIFGLHTNMHDVNLEGLLDPEAIEKMATSAWQKFWGGYIQFGNISAGILMTIFIYQVTKTLLGTICNMFALHSAYGFSFHLLAACWNGATNLCLHRYHHRRTTYAFPRNDAEGAELRANFPYSDDPEFVQMNWTFPANGTTTPPANHATNRPRSGTTFLATNMSTCPLIPPNDKGTVAPSNTPRDNQPENHYSAYPRNTPVQAFPADRTTDSNGSDAPTPPSAPPAVAPTTQSSNGPQYPNLEEIKNIPNYKLS